MTGPHYKITYTRNGEISSTYLRSVETTSELSSCLILILKFGGPIVSIDHLTDDPFGD